MNDQERIKWLEAHGYAIDIDGIPCPSEAGYILWGKLNDSQQDRVLRPSLREYEAAFDTDILQALEKRTAILQKQYGTDDMWIILYCEAVKAEQ